MRPWDEDPPPPRPFEPPTLDELEAAGIDLDPRSHGLHRHGEVVHAHDHPHPHREADEEGRPIIGIVGAGPVGTALGAAFARAGWTVGAVASRDAGRRERFRSLVPGARAFAEPAAILDECHLIFLTVPDDAIPEVAGSIHLYSGQALVHTSGLLGPEALAAAMAAGTEAGSFHPLVAFADVERAIEALRGATIALEGSEGLVGLLAELAEAVGGVPVRLAPGSKPAYHAAAVLAAGGFVALLDAIAQLGRSAGLDEGRSLAVFGPLIEQTLANAQVLGIDAALTGPTIRNDLGTLVAHRVATRSVAPGVADLQLALMVRAVEIAERRGALAPEDATRMRAELAKPS